MMGNYFEIDEHHIHPRFMDNPLGLGKKYMLSQTEHIKLHLIIPSIIWKYIPKHLKQKCINEVISFSEHFINNQKEKNNSKIYDFENKIECGIDNINCPECDYPNDIDDEECQSCKRPLKFDKSLDTY